jgi:hypothetical protein
VQHRKVVLAALLFLVVTEMANGGGWNRKTTKIGWTWFDDYVFAWATFKVACEPDRRCEVGMGMFAFGRPLGQRVSFAGEREILVVGMGAIHIRPDDGKGPVKAAVALDEAGLLKVSWDF